MTGREQRAAALAAANDKRLRIAALRRRIISERGALQDVLRDPPDELADWPLIDVVRLSYGKRTTVSMQQLGRLALRDGVNLMMPLGRASLRSREWLAGHASWHWN